MSGTRVTSRCLDTNEVESVTVTNDYVIVTDGTAYIANLQMHANGTHVLTIKGRQR